MVAKKQKVKFEVYKAVDSNNTPINISDLIENINLLKKYGNYGIDIKVDKVTKDKVDLAHLNGAKVNVWTVNNKEDIKKLTDMGVDMITSDLGF